MEQPPFFVKIKYLDEASFQKLLPILLSELKESFDQLIIGLKQANLKQVGMMAHKMKGAAASFGAVRISEGAARVEKVLREHASGNELSKSVEMLQIALETTRQYSLKELMNKDVPDT